MSINAKASGDFKQVEPGVYIARCFKLIDLGTQIGEWQGKPTARHQVLISFEIPDELIEGGDYDGQPYSLSKFYTLSLNERATLRKDLVSWRKKEFTAKELESFDLTKIVGLPCQIQVIHSETTGKAKISNIMGMLKNTACPPAINPTTIFDLEEYLNGDESVYNTLSDGIKGMIDSCDEVKHTIRDNGEVPNEPMNPNGIDEDVPF